MRKIVGLALLALAACSPPLVWQQADGQPLDDRELRSAQLACGTVMAGPTWRAQTPSANLADATHIYEQLEDSPAFGVVSSAGFAACLHSFGYREAEAASFYGTLTPPSR